MKSTSADSAKLFLLDMANALRPNVDYTLGPRRPRKQCTIKLVQKLDLLKVLQNPLYKCFANLLSHPNLDVTPGDEESVYIDSLLNALFETGVFYYLLVYLNTQGYPYRIHDFRAKFRQKWFKEQRYGNNHFYCLFSHVFVGYVGTNTLHGFHNWVSLLLLQYRNQIWYKPSSANALCNPEEPGINVLKIYKLNRNGIVKACTTMMEGVSLVLELALFTMAMFSNKASN